MELTNATVLERYKRALRDGESEHKRVLDEVVEFYGAYALKSFEDGDFADLRELWGSHPPEVAILLSAVNTFWGSLISSRREPAFPGFDLGTADAVKGEAFTQLVKAGRRWAGSEAVDRNVVLDAILVGYGFARQSLETETRPPFRPDEEYVTADRVWWDPGGHAENLTGAEEMIIRDHFSIDEAEARFPEHSEIWATVRLAAGGGTGGGAAAREGAQFMGGKNIQVVSAADGRAVSSGSSPRRLREVAIDDFQFRHWEQMVGWYGPDAETGTARWHESRAEDFDEAMERRASEAEMAGQPFEPPQTTPYPQATWYRARILAAGAQGEPEVVKEAEPIQGNQRLARAMTAYIERYKPDGGGDVLRTRHFGFGRVLLGIQRLLSIAMRLYIEQEARRNRDGWDFERSAFGGDDKARNDFINSRRVPGSVYEGPDGFYDKVHKREEQPKSHSSEMQQMFKFMGGDLVSYSLGVSDVSRGTFTEDRSAKWMTALQESALQMQTQYTQAFTAYLDEGAITMARLMILHLDPEDLDRLLGEQELIGGVTGQKDENGVLQPITGPPGPDGEPGETLTLGRYLKENLTEIMGNDIAFGLRPSAASERMSQSMLMIQHGFIEQIAGLLDHIPEAKEILAPAALRGSFAEGSAYANIADKLEELLARKKQENEAAAAAQTEDGWLQFIQQKSATDFEGAIEMLKQAQATLAAPQPEPEQVQ